MQQMSDISAAYILQWIEQIDTIYNHNKQLQNYLYSRIPMGINNYGTECLLSGLPILTNNKISTDIFGDLLVKKYYKPLDDSINANKLYDNIIILPCNLSITTNILIYLSRILEPICE